MLQRLPRSADLVYMGEQVGRILVHANGTSHVAVGVVADLGAHWTFL